VEYRFNVIANNRISPSNPSAMVRVMPLPPASVTALASLPSREDLVEDPVLDQGSETVIELDGFSPNEWVVVSIHSTPRTLNTVRADGLGVVRAHVLIPANMMLGEHTLSVLGLASGAGAKMPVRITGSESTPGSGFSALATPVRLLDTRSGSKVGALDGSAVAYELQVSGRGGLPVSGVAAAALNVTVVDGQARNEGGYVTVYPCGTRPDASNLNFVSGQTIPNSVIAPVSASGKVCFYVYGRAHLLADVSGYLVN
jgi:hypothetical protein